MTRDDAFCLIEEILVDGLGVQADAIALEADLKTDLGLDSLDGFELISALQSRMGARLSQRAIEGLSTVADVVEAACEQVAKTDAEAMQ